MSKDIVKKEGNAFFWLLKQIADSDLENCTFSEIEDIVNVVLMKAKKEKIIENIESFAIVREDGDRALIQSRFTIEGKDRAVDFILAV